MSVIGRIHRGIERSDLPDTFRYQENGEGSLYLFHGVGAVPKHVGLNDLVFGKG